MTVNEIITVQVGNCTIFARYVAAGLAAQVVVNARLTYFYEHEDWKRRLKAGQAAEPLLLARYLAGFTRAAAIPTTSFLIYSRLQCARVPSERVSRAI